MLNDIFICEKRRVATDAYVQESCEILLLLSELLICTHSKEAIAKQPVLLVSLDRRRLWHTLVKVCELSQAILVVAILS